MGAPQPPPTQGQDPFAQPDSGGSPTIRQGKDGSYYQLVNGAWQKIPGMEDPSPQIQTGETVSPWSTLPGGGDAPFGVPSFTPIMGSATSSAGKTAIASAELSLMSGQGTKADYDLLVQAGMTPAQILALTKYGDGPGGSGGSGNALGYADLSERQREFDITNARNEKSDAYTAAMNNLKAMADQSVQYDARARAAQGDRLSAVQYLADPGAAFVGAYQPNSAVVREGLASPVVQPHMAFNPDAIMSGNPNDAAVQAAMQHLQSLSAAYG